MDIAYGIEVLPHNDPFIDTAEKAAASINAAGKPGSFLVDFMPFRTCLFICSFVRV